MKLFFLGTGAADRMEIEPDNDFSNKDNRRCSCAILDGKIMFDCGPHAISSLNIAGFDLSSITDIVITHLHRDHFNLENINLIAEKNNNLRVWMRQDAVYEGKCFAEIYLMKPYNTYEIDGYSFTGMRANHDPLAFAQHISVEKDGKKLFYGMDGAWLLNETVAFMKKKEYNLVVLDATVGDYSGDFRIGEHNSIPMIRLMTDSMKTLKIINKETDIILNHIACCLHKSYNETCEIVKPDGYIVAYDGFCIKI